MNNNYIEHHGILGQKWGVRRFQNQNGSLTEAGKKRYGVAGRRELREARKADKTSKRYGVSANIDRKLHLNRRASNNQLQSDLYKNKADYHRNNAESISKRNNSKGRSKVEKALLVAGGVTIAAAAAYGVSKNRNRIPKNVFDLPMAEVITPRLTRSAAPKSLPGRGPAKALPGPGRGAAKALPAPPTGLVPVGNRGVSTKLRGRGYTGGVRGGRVVDLKAKDRALARQLALGAAGAGAAVGTVGAGVTTAKRFNEARDIRKNGRKSKYYDKYSRKRSK